VPNIMTRVANGVLLRPDRSHVEKGNSSCATELYSSASP
jgi:hypothetical protein